MIPPRPKFSLLLCGLLLAACSPPPPVKAADDWLTAYTAGDIPAVLRNTAPADRPLVEAALKAQAEDPRAALALLLPPKPLKHEYLEKSEQGPGRQVILMKLSLKNPLPYAGDKVGQPLPGVPRERGQWRRFLVEKEGKTWGVRLDLERVRARTVFVERFLDALERRDFDRAQAMLAQVPPLPDVPESKVDTDRLPVVLTAELKNARVRVSTSTAAGVRTSTAPRVGLGRGNLPGLPSARPFFPGLELGAVKITSTIS